MTELDTNNYGIFTPDPARQVAWIVYINGIEVPANSVSISYGVWRIPQCEIAVVPDASLQRLGAEDRLAVQVFYCDYWQNPSLPEFRLMFDGEIVAWSYVNTIGGRSIVFTCVDYIQIFTQIFFFFMSSIEDIAVGEAGKQIGMTDDTIHTAGYGAIYPYSLFSQGLVDPGESKDVQTSGGQNVITRPIDFIYNIVRALSKGGHYNKTVPGVNFFAPWIKRTNFHKRFIAIPFLEEVSLDEKGQAKTGIFPILRAVTQDNAIAAVVRMGSDIGTSGSIWQLVQSILQTLMMELCMLPTPACVDSDLGKKTPSDQDGIFNVPGGSGFGLEIGGPAVSTSPLISVSATGDPSDKQDLTGRGRLAGNNFLTQYFVKPEFLFGLPPVSNVFFPSQITNFAYEENYITQPTRTYFNVENLVDILKPDNAGIEGIMRSALSVAHPEEANARVRAAALGAAVNSKDLLVYPEEFFKGPVIDRRVMPRWFYYLQQANPATAEAAAGKTATTTVNSNRQVTPGDTSRDLFRLYTAYEYHKERYARRTGTISLAFNPYPIPGFPCVIFDRRSTQMDIFGYITTVRHTLGTNGWESQIGYSYARTVREMFSLLQQQYDLENTSLKEAQTVIREALNTTDDKARADKLNSIAAPIGAIAMSPPEPLVEIRDIIQNFDRAEQFYKTLFYRNPAPKSEETMLERTRAEFDRQTNEQREQRSALFASIATVGSARPTAVEAQSQVSLDLSANKRAVFYYPEIIELVEGRTADSRGKTHDIKIVGLDASSRAKLVNIISAMRAGTATEAEVVYAQKALGRDTPPNVLDMQRDDNNKPTKATDAVKIQEFNDIEINLRTGPTDTNLPINPDIQLKDSAKDIYNSYDAAMRYNARPICTLDEYIDFMGIDGRRGEKIIPSTTLSAGDSRSFTAVYYTSIRNYRSGPPPIKAPEGVTNTPIQTSVDGMTDKAKDANTTPVTSNPRGIDAATFPDNRQDWNTILTAYRYNVLRSLTPKR